MKESELKAKFTRIVQIARAELRMRQWVFRDHPEKLAKKVAEMEELERLVTELKDALKPHVEVEMEQPALLEVPKKAEYR